jgi:hypothetical protein
MYDKMRFRQMSKKKISDEMYHREYEFKELLDKVYYQTQDEAKQTLIEFFGQMQDFEIKYFGEYDMAIDDNIRLQTNSNYFPPYPEFLTMLSYFRNYYLQGDYVQAAHSLEEIMHLRRFFFEGCKAGLLEAGKEVMGDDFPKKEKV